MAEDLHGINAGDMRFRVDVEVNTSTTTPKGEAIPSWTKVADRWASITPAAGQFFTASEQIRNKVSHKVVMRYFAGLTPRHRIKSGSRVFNVLSVLDESELHVRHTLLVTEVV